MPPPTGGGSYQVVVGRNAQRPYTGAPSPSQLASGVGRLSFLPGIGEISRSEVGAP